MAQFGYQGVDRAGKKVTGQLEAINEGDLRMQLRNQGVRPTKISRAGLMNTDLSSLIKGNSISLGLTQLLAFTRQLQVLVSSGIPVVQALEILEEQSLDKGPKRLFGNLKEKISGGMFLGGDVASP